MGPLQEEQLEKKWQRNLLNGTTFRTELINNYNNNLLGAFALVIQRRMEVPVSRKKHTLESRYQTAINKWYWLWLQILILPLIKYAGGGDEFDNFIRSDDYRSVPQAKIEATLYAHILTNKSGMHPGDLGDISQLSAILPYCNIVLVDRKMQNLIRKYRFDQEFRTQVHSLSDFDMLINGLERL